MITSLIRKFDAWWLAQIDIGRLSDYIDAWIGLPGFDGDWRQWVRMSIKGPAPFPVNAKTFEVILNPPPS